MDDDPDLADKAAHTQRKPDPRRVFLVKDMPEEYAALLREGLDRIIADEAENS